MSSVTKHQTQSTQLLHQLLQGLCSVSHISLERMDFLAYIYFSESGGEKTNFAYPFWLLLSKPEEEVQRNVTVLPKEDKREL